MNGCAMKLAPVTDHATIRYCERVLGFNVRAVTNRLKRLTGMVPGNKALLLAIAEEMNADPDVLRNRVLPAELWDQVRATERFGCTTLKVNGHVCKLQAGRVTTVWSKNRKGRLTVRSKREIRKSYQRQDRRAR